jgi:large subunit ribosomal protein L15
MVRVHKRKKSSRMHGRKMGSHGWGARKKHKKSGHKGGKGMSGSGKRADHKKTLITKLYGNSYFGKQGITSKRTEKDKRKRINLQSIEMHPEKYGKKKGDVWEIELKTYKILGTGEVKNKLKIHAYEASASAIEKVKKAGGEIIVKEKKVLKTPLVESPRLIERRERAKAQAGKNSEAKKEKVVVKEKVEKKK